MLASALLVLALSADTPGVIEAALDHHLERKCGTSWASQRTLVSDAAIAPHLGHPRNRAVDVVPEDLRRRLATMPAGPWLDLPSMFYPFRAATDPPPAAHGYHAIIRFSLPAFGALGKSAAIYMVYDCGGDCAEGRLLYLERRPHGWVVIHDVSLWIS